MAYYKDLREYLEALELHGKLVRVDFEVNKDTELHPMVRLQYRGLPESERKAFLFQNIVDARGHRYATRYAVCCMAGSRDIYALGMQCKPEEIVEKFTQAQLNPIPPVLVPSGPVHEEVHVGDGLLEHGGLDEFPIPISTPGFDSSAYLTGPYWFTSDPETGVRNVGTYRGQLQAPDRIGVNVSPTPMAWRPGLGFHWDIAKRQGRPLQAAVVLGATPNVAYVSVAPIPHGVDELTVAGGLSGAPVELVKCKTVDLEVPARAEIVLEGEIPTDQAEVEAPFGESTGYMCVRDFKLYFNIKCITHRRQPILQGFLSQFPPSESTTLRVVAWANVVYKYLKYDCGISSVLDVALHEACCASFYVVVRLRRGQPRDAARVMEVLARRDVLHIGKVFVLVDDDIDPQDADAVNWAICTRSQPHRDLRVVRIKAEVVGLDHSVEPPELTALRGMAEEAPEASILIIDTTMKWDYPPVSLPKKEYMERALELWHKAGLPGLQLRAPWSGYSLGHWTEQDEEEADLAVRGEYYKTGQKNAQHRGAL